MQYYKSLKKAFLILKKGFSKVEISLKSYNHKLSDYVTHPVPLLAIQPSIFPKADREGKAFYEN
jgi:hypothetical protein